MAKDCCNDDDHEGYLKSAKWVLWIAFFGNFIMFLLEAGTSFKANSESLKADAIDFFGDSMSYIMTLVVLRSSLELRNRVASVKGWMMFLMGVGVLAAAIYRVFYGVVPEAHTMGIVGFAALVVNVGVAALLFRFRGRDMNMQSVWLCSRNDALGNLAVLAAAAGVWGTQTRWPDLFVASIIAVLNLSGSYTVLKSTRS